MAGLQNRSCLPQRLSGRQLRSAHPWGRGGPFCRLGALFTLLLGAAAAVLVAPGEDPFATSGAPERSVRPRTLPVLDPPAPWPAAPLVPAAPEVVALVPELLLSQLAVGDLQWLPRVEPLPDGGVRYTYKRRSGDPSLNLDQIRALIANPPTHARERQFIRRAIEALPRVGVRLSLAHPRRSGAAGEWDPAHRLLRIAPSVVGKGSRDFALVLNHELIHVAQSCRAGGVGRAPRLLGLSSSLSSTLRRHLNDPVYVRATPLEQGLEREAYANQHLLPLGLELVLQHCSAGRALEHS